MKNKNNYGFTLKRCQAFFDIPQELENQSRKLSNKEKIAIEVLCNNSVFRPIDPAQITNNANHIKLIKPIPQYSK